MENNLGSAIPGARPASTNNPHKVEKGSLMPQFGGGRGVATSEREPADKRGAVTDAREPADKRGAATDAREPADKRGAATDAREPADNHTPIDEKGATTHDTPTEAGGFGIDLDHLDTLFENQPATNAPAPGAPGAPQAPTQVRRPLSPNSPLNRPMQRAAPVAPAPPPKRRNLFPVVGGIIIVVALIVIVGIVVAMNSRSSDPVVQAINKILDGQAPANVEIHGDVSMEPDDKYAVLSKFNLAMDVQLIPSSLINNTNLKLTMSGKNVSEQTISIDEVYAANGAVYLRPSGVAATIENVSRDMTMTAGGQVQVQEDEEETPDGGDASEVDEFSEQTSSDGDETVVTEEFATDLDIWSLIPVDSIWTPLLAIAQDVDNSWVQIPVGEDAPITEGIEALTPGSILKANREDFDKLTCNLDLLGKMRNNLNTLMQVYRGHQFIGSTTEGVTLTARNYPVRKLVYDRNTYIGFVNAANEVKLFDEYMRCTGMTTEDLYKIPGQLPEILVEVSPENTFTRVNWTSPVEGGKMNADLGLKYPANPVNVQTPKEFMTLNQVLQMEGDFLNQEVEVDDTVVDEDCPACDPGAEDCVCEDTEVEQDAEY